MMAAPTFQNLENSPFPFTDSQLADHNLMSQGTLEELEKNGLNLGPFDLDNLSPSVPQLPQYLLNSQGQDPVMPPIITMQNSALMTISGANLSSSQNMPDSQASTGSQSENVQPDVPFPGRYNFSVTVDKNNAKQTIYSSNLNQLFVTDDLQVGFDIKFDFKACKDAKLVAFLRHSETCDAAVAVKRCMKHVLEARRNREKGLKSRSNEPEAEEHILICTDEKANHFQDKLQRCKVEIPLRSPAPGCEAVKKVFLFKCKNSDDFGHQKKKPSWTIIFELKTKTNETVGRQVMKLKVSACPQRDYQKVDGKSEGSRTKRRSTSSATSSRPAKRASAAAGAPRIFEDNDLDTNERTFGSEEQVDADWVQQAWTNFNHLYQAMQCPENNQEMSFLQGFAMVLEGQVKQFDIYRSSSITVPVQTAQEFIKTEADDSNFTTHLYDNDIYSADHI